MRPSWRRSLPRTCSSSCSARRASRQGLGSHRPDRAVDRRGAGAHGSADRQPGGADPRARAAASTSHSMPTGAARRNLATLLLQISAVALPTIAVAFARWGGRVCQRRWYRPASSRSSRCGPRTRRSPRRRPRRLMPRPPPSATPPAEPAMAARHALLDTLVLLPVLTWFILDATQVAVVVLIIIVTLLRQHDPKQGQRAALGLILGNLIGGIAAAIVYNLVLLNNTLAVFHRGLPCREPHVRRPHRDGGRSRTGLRHRLCDLHPAFGARHDTLAGRQRRGFRGSPAQRSSRLGLRDRWPVACAALAETTDDLSFDLAAHQRSLVSK